MKKKRNKAIDVSPDLSWSSLLQYYVPALGDPGFLGSLPSKPARTARRKARLERKRS